MSCVHVISSSHLDCPLRDHSLRWPCQKPSQSHRHGATEQRESVSHDWNQITKDSGSTSTFCSPTTPTSSSTGPSGSDSAVDGGRPVDQPGDQACREPADSKRRQGCRHACEVATTGPSGSDGAENGRCPVDPPGDKARLIPQTLYVDKVVDAPVDATTGGALSVG